MSLDDFTNDLTAHITNLTLAVGSAKDEIRAARTQYPHADDRVRRNFPLLAPALPVVESESVYRAHCRELLGRVAAGTDTRPATAAECCFVLATVGQLLPLNKAATRVYTRLRKQAGLHTETTNGRAEHRTGHDAQAVEDAGWLRNWLRQDWRVLPSAQRARPDDESDQDHTA